MFIKDHPRRVIEEGVFASLLTLPNVLITGRQGFFSHEPITIFVALPRRTAGAA